MNDRRQRFVREYLIDLNATQAAIRSGYSKKTAGQIGHELLKDPHIAAAIVDAQTERAAKVDLDAQWVLDELIANVRNARDAKDFNASNRALELLGKHLALFPDKLTVDFKEVAKLTDEELDERRRALRLVS